MSDSVVQFSPGAIDALRELLSEDEASVTIIRDDRQNAFFVEATGNWCNFCTRLFRSTDPSLALLKAAKERNLILEEPGDIQEEEMKGEED